MLKTCLGLDDLASAQIPYGYKSVAARMGKATKVDVPGVVSKRAAQPMEKIHMDIKGPFMTPSFNGHKYLLVWVDDFSHYSWVAFLTLKSEVIGQIKRFHADTAIIRKSFPWCCLRCDNAGENTSLQLKDWLTENGIRLETSTPHEPWHNGLVETHVRQIMNINRTQLVASGLGAKY